MDVLFEATVGRLGAGMKALCKPALNRRAIAAP